MEIRANNGKIYKDIRAYHIAMGHAVRQALIDFAYEVEDYCMEKVQEFYSEYTPDYYERTYQLLNKMRLGELIKIQIKGNFEGKYDFSYNLFDWTVLDAHSNGRGKFGTYTSFDGSDARGEIEEYLYNGIIGHSSFDLYFEIDKYIEEHLDDRIQQVLNRF